MYRRKRTIVGIVIILILLGVTATFVFVSLTQQTTERQTTLMPYVGDSSRTTDEIRTMQIDNTPSITIIEPLNYERLDYSIHTITVEVKQPIAGLIVSIQSVEYRYEYIEGFSEWTEMSLDSETAEISIYEAKIRLSDLYFIDGQSYTLEVKCVASVLQFSTDSIVFYVDDNPASGIVFSSLKEPTEILCSYEKETIAFYSDLILSESHYFYETEIPTQWQEQLLDPSLIVGYEAYHSLLSDIEIVSEGDTWKLILIFTEKPTENEYLTLYIYQETPTIANPQVEQVDLQEIYLSLEYSAQREFSNIHISEVIFPSEKLESAWWGTKLNAYQTWQVFDQNSEKLEGTVKVTTSPVNQYEARVEIIDLICSADVTRLIIKGTTTEEPETVTEPTETEPASYFSIPLLMIILLLPFAGYTLMIGVEYTGREISTSKKRLTLIVLGVIGAGIVGIMFLLQSQSLLVFIPFLPLIVQVSLITLGALTGYVALEYTDIVLSDFKKVGSFIGFLSVGAVLSIIIPLAVYFDPIGRAYVFITSIQMPKLSVLVPELPAVQIPTTLFVLAMPSVVIMLIILFAKVLGSPFDRKQTINLLLIDLTLEVLLSIVYIQGVLSLSITGLETAEQMIINIAFSGLIAGSIIVATALILKSKAGELSVG